MISHNKQDFPPSSAIVRDNKIDINPYKFREFVSQLKNIDYLNANSSAFIGTMNRIRLAVQSNLGMSEIDRNAHETYQPVWIKKGKPNLISTKVIYNHAPEVQVIDDQTDDDGFSIIFQTKFREFSLYINDDGKVTSSLELKWDEIFKSLSPESSGNQAPFRSFTPWQRYAESNFFNGRSTSKVLSYLSQGLPDIFSYDAKSYYCDDQSETIEIDTTNHKSINSLGRNLYLKIDPSLLAEPTILDHGKQQLLAVIKRKSSLMGSIIQLAPVIHDNGKFHIVLHGHQEETTVEKIIVCDFKTQSVVPMKWSNGPLIIHGEGGHENKWTNLHLLKNEYREILKRTSAAPMVRASDAVMRKYWHGCYDIPTIYTEMITIADIFNQSKSNANAKDKLESIYYCDAASSGFRRLNFSDYELNQAKNIAVQIVVPHDSADDMKYWGKHGENIERTINMAVQVVFHMVPDEVRNKLRLAINMCCPAASIERMGGGFGLCQKPEYVANILHGIKNKYPDLAVEFKTLMLSESASDSISENNNKALSKMISDKGGDRLVWQAKPRNQEQYHLMTTADVTRSSSTNNQFKFGYSGMVAALTNQGLFKLGYNQIGSPHDSVESVLTNYADFEVMLGRVLLGSSWLLGGRYPEDNEILLLTILQSFLLREFAIGAGDYGIDLMQIQIIYNVRHIKDENLRNILMNDIFASRSSEAIIEVLYEGYRSITNKHDLDDSACLKPSMLKLKTAILRTGYDSLYSDREKRLDDHIPMLGRLTLR